MKKMNYSKPLAELVETEDIIITSDFTRKLGAADSETIELSGSLETAVDDGKIKLK